MKKTSIFIRRRAVWRNILVVVCITMMIFSLCACGKKDRGQNALSQSNAVSENTGHIEDSSKGDTGNGTEAVKTMENMAENFVLVPGGTFQMGSPLL